MELLILPHDVRDMRRMEVRGWSGEHVFSYTTRTTQVIIEVPKRHPSEFWTYERQGDLLVCHTSLLSDPHLLIDTNPDTGKMLKMHILLPERKRVAGFEVTFLPG